MARVGPQRHRAGGGNLKDQLAYGWQGYVVKIPRLSDWQIGEAILHCPHIWQ